MVVGYETKINRIKIPRRTWGAKKHNDYPTKWDVRSRDVQLHEWVLHVSLKSQFVDRWKSIETNGANYTFHQDEIAQGIYIPSSAGWEWGVRRITKKSIPHRAASPSLWTRRGRRRGGADARGRCCRPSASGRRWCSAWPTLSPWTSPPTPSPPPEPPPPCSTASARSPTSPRAATLATSTSERSPRTGFPPCAPPPQPAAPGCSTPSPSPRAPPLPQPRRRRPDHTPPPSVRPPAPFPLIFLCILCICSLCIYVYVLCVYMFIYAKVRF